MNDTYSQYQFDDLKIKDEDFYAATKYAIIRDKLARYGVMRILNAGCGSGELSFLLARAGHYVRGIDPSAEYIALARSRGNIDRVDFTVSSIEDFSSGELFDAIVATDVLEHIKNDRAAMAKLACLVRPGGLLIVTVPALPWLFGYHDKMLGHWRRYTKQTLTALFAAAGLSEMNLRYFGFTLIPVAILYSKLFKRPYPVSPSGLSSGNQFRQFILRWLLIIDRYVKMPIGTSLIGVANVGKK